MPAIIKPSRLAAAVRSEPVPKGGLLTVSAFLLSDMESPRDFLAEQALWPMVVQQMGGAIFDKGNLKPCGEWIIAGAALAPGEAPVTGINVVARFGEVEKQLSVFGDRFWRQTDRGIGLVSALPFDRMPINEAHAFGGPAFAVNPRGKGHGARKLLDAGLDAPLPNVEEAARAVRSPDDVARPAHFGPIAPDAPSRMRFVGTYDQTWLETLAPLRPADFNPLFHCDAPEEQRLKGYVAGDEAFSIAGMTRGGMVAGQLPNVVVRGFVHRPVEDSLTEIKLVCDTVTLFPNVTKMVLTFRGVVACTDAFAEDVGSVMLAVEHAEDEARPSAYYGEIFRLRTSPDEAHKHALSDFQLMPRRDEAAVGARRAARLAKAQQDRERFVDNQNWLMGKVAADQGISPALLRPMDVADVDDLPLVAMPSQEDIARGEFDLAEIIDDVTTLTDALKEKGRRSMAEAELERRWLADNMPGQFSNGLLARPIASDEQLLEFPDLTSELATAIGSLDLGPPPFDMGELATPRLDELRAGIDGLVGTLEGDGPERSAEADAQFAKACARALGQPEGSILHDVRPALEGLTLPVASTPDDATGGSEIEEAILRGLASFADKPLGGMAQGETPINAIVDAPEAIDLSAIQSLQDGMAGRLKAILPDVKAAREGASATDLISELLDNLPQEKASPDGVTAQAAIDRAMGDARSRLGEAEQTIEAATRQARTLSPAPLFPREPFLAGVSARLGDFVSEQLQAGHDFRGADLAGADLRGLDLRGRDLRGTLFEACDLRDVDFSGADLQGAVFAGADLGGANLAGANIDHVNFGECRLAGAKLDGCAYRQASLIRVDMSGLSWRSGMLSGLSLIECDMDGADFSGSTLAEVQILKGMAAGACFQEAVLDRTTFIQNALEGARFDNARFDRVALVEVRAKGASFEGARFTGSGFVGQTDLSDAKFERIVARDSSWNTADMRRACLLRADCERCLFNACDLSGADMRLATLAHCRLDKSSLVGVDLFAGNLFSASLAHCDLTRASLRGANLYFAALDYAAMPSCDLTGANLGGTMMGRANHA